MYLPLPSNQFTGKLSDKFRFNYFRFQLAFQLPVQFIPQSAPVSFCILSFSLNPDIFTARLRQTNIRNESSRSFNEHNDMNANLVSVRVYSKFCVSVHSLFQSFV